MRAVIKTVSIGVIPSLVIGIREILNRHVEKPFAGVPGEP